MHCCTIFYDKRRERPHKSPKTCQVLPEWPRLADEVPKHLAPENRISVFTIILYPCGLSAAVAADYEGSKSLSVPSALQADFRPTRQLLKRPIHPSIDRDQLREVAFSLKGLYRLEPATKAFNELLLLRWPGSYSTGVL